MREGHSPHWALCFAVSCLQERAVGHKTCHRLKSVGLGDSLCRSALWMCLWAAEPHKGCFVCLFVFWNKVLFLVNNIFFLFSFFSLFPSISLNKK